MKEQRNYRVGDLVNYMEGELESKMEKAFRKGMIVGAVIALASVILGFHV